MGNIIGNTLGNLPDDYWEEFKKIETCDEPGCDCHLLAQKIMPSLIEIREDFRKTMAARSRKN